ncbi:MULTISPECIES: DUF4383 domain-containing protein [unclassified Nocardioides]|uniref:DUF4383 domain-containing protein n=1 Tax=unclassified Nocardioides TaxID=2615069 RepID=UPI001E4938B4|nr:MULTISPECIES: DUF4383 domain-containing protein [unclassified Nocardioides]
MTERTTPSGASDPSPARGIAGPSTGDRLARTMALATGALFLVVGVAGFIPGVTTNVGDLEFAGHHSDAELLGIFQVSVLHNLLHLLFGVAGIALSRRGIHAAAYLLVGGVAYLGLWVYGLVNDHHSDANFVPLNSADNWLHLVLGVAMLVMGLVALRAVRGGIGSQTAM